MAILDIPAALEHVLQRTGEWKFLTTLLPPDLSPVNHPQGAEWIRAAAAHRHPFRQILIVLQGAPRAAYNIVLGDHLFRATPGTIIFLDTLEAHATIEHILTAPMRVLRLNVLQGRIFARLWLFGPDAPSQHADGDDIFVPGDAARYLERRWSELRERRALPVPLKRSVLMHGIGSLMVGVLEHWAPERRSAWLSPEEIWIGIAEHLLDTGGVGVSLDTLAAAADCDRQRLALMCRSQTGLSIHQYVRRCRIEKARRLLARGYSHKEIAAALGFTHASAFSRWHRQYLSEVP